MGDVAKHFDSGKPPLGWLPGLALMEVAKVYEYGHNKYGDVHNWRKGMEWQRLINSALRHLEWFNAGQDIDPESGIGHLSHVAFNILALIEMQRTHPELDDRYKLPEELLK